MNVVGRRELSRLARTIPVISFAIGSVLLTSSPVGATERGIASHYAASFHGRRTASGERLDMHALTCAHRTAPFGAHLRVSSGSRSVVCRVTDRGSFARGRIIDLTPAAARALGGSGLLHVTIERM
jgi:rare lipoprotein A